MGSYAALVAGFPISISQIDEALGTSTSFQGKPSSTFQEVRYDAKTGEKRTVNKRMPAIPAFRHVKIVFNDVVYVDRLDGITNYYATKIWDSAKEIAGLPPDYKFKEEYNELMSAFADTYGLEISGSYYDREFIFLNRSCRCDSDFVPISWFEDPKLRDQVAAQQQVLERLGFKGIKFGITPEYNE